MPAPLRSVPGEVLRLLAALVPAFAAVTGLALVLSAAGVGEPGQMARRLLVPLYALFLILMLRLPLRDLPGAAGLRPLPRHPLRACLLGFAAGAGSVVLLCALLLAGGARKWEIEAGPGLLLLKGLSYFLRGLVLGLLEEGLFRGLIHGRLEQAGGALRAVLVGSLLFGLAHFMHAPDGYEGAWDVVPGALAGLATVPAHLPAVAGLFLVGLVLALIRHRTGGIVVGIGVHAGWFWVKGLDGRLIEEVPAVVDAHPLLLGSGRFYDGLAGWAALLGSLLLVWIFVPARGAGGRALP